MQIDEKKLVELVSTWEHIPSGEDGDEVQVVLAHEISTTCAMQLKKLMLESARLVQQIAPASSGDIHLEAD